ncbi:MAG: hypothetical protein HY744_16775 [Deltaproteobacteria bacterium]|nr:hypothetical protein [Deltaproteobacteria bacterium]
MTEVTALERIEGTERPYDPTARPIWEVIAEIGASVPDEEWEKVPRDLAENHDHYLYGAPKPSRRDG